MKEETGRLTRNKNSGKLVSGERRKISESDNGLPVRPPSAAGGKSNNSHFDPRLTPALENPRATNCRAYLGFEFSASTITWQCGFLTSHRGPSRNHLTTLV